MNELIKQRWQSSDAFYSERDHRTRLEVANLHAYVNKPVEIFVSPEAANDPTIQRITLLAANLTARWARNIRVVVPRVILTDELQTHGDDTLQERIARELNDADPFGNWNFDESRSPTPSALRLFIGSPDDFLSASEDYVVDASGWSALGHRGIGVQGFRRNPATVSAAALAAAIGAADLFKRAIGHTRDHWLGTINWCTWTHTLTRQWPATVDGHPILLSVDVGNLLLAGTGAIGSALLYILSLAAMQGRMTILDRDCVDTSNLNRSPLFTAAHAAANLKKTEVAREFIEATGIQVDVVDGTWREHGERLSRDQFDVWVSLTNEDGAWAEVPFQLPPVVLHGTTSGWGIAFGRHIPRVEDCTACRLPRPTAEFRGPCAEGDLPVAESEQPARASLPFLSTAAAALVAAELLKLQQGSNGSLPNAVSADFAFGLPTVIALSRHFTPGCHGCQIAGLPLWSQRGGRSRYATLSATEERNI